MFSYVLAAVPEMPDSVPRLNLVGTSASSIHVDFNSFEEIKKEGSPILSYELEVYRTELKRWISIVGGYNSFSLLNSYVYADNI